MSITRTQPEARHGGGPDRAAVYASLNPAWQLLSGPVSLALIILFLSPEAQGIFYTFYSLVALRSFFELGLNIVVVNTASHEWAHLELDGQGNIRGDAASLSRLISLGRFIFRWYGIASILFIFTVGACGAALLHSRGGAGVNWQWPWMCFVLIYGLLLWTLPFNSILEGCNQVVTIQKFRLLQSVTGTLGLWLALAAGAGLWSLAVFATVFLLRDLYLLLVQYRRFFVPFFWPPAGPVIEWRREIMPMQWRLAVSGIVNYFAYWLFTPVMLWFHGAEAAGRMGMTWHVVTILQQGGMAWIVTRVPAFGALIARRRFDELLHQWLHASARSLGAIALLAAAFFLFVLVINGADFSWAGRILGPGPTLMLLCGAVLMQMSQCMSAYFRAHKQEPILIMSVTTSLMIGAAVYLLGGSYGPAGAAAGYLGVTVIIVLWEAAIWLRFRRQYDSD